MTYYSVVDLFYGVGLTLKFKEVRHVSLLSLRSHKSINL